MFLNKNKYYYVEKFFKRALTFSDNPLSLIKS